MVVSNTPTDKTMNHEKFVTVTLKLPKGFMQFLNDFKTVTGFDTIQELG